MKLNLEKTNFLRIAPHNISAVFLLAILWQSSASGLDEATISKFWPEKPVWKNTHDDYVLPAIEPALTIFVDFQGIGGQPSDENPGTKEKPFKTLRAALIRLRHWTNAPRYIMLRGGTYRMDGIIFNAGIAQRSRHKDRPFVVSSYKNERAVLTSAVPLKGWKKLDGTNVYYHNLPRRSFHTYSTLYVNDRIVPSIREHLFSEKGLKEYSVRSTKPVDAATFVTAPGTWAKKRERIYLRAPGDSDPNSLRVEISAFRRGMKAALAINSYNLVFNRLIFEKNTVAVVVTGERVAFRRCIFSLNEIALDFGALGSMGETIDKNSVDQCLFVRNGSPLGGALRFHGPITLRDSIFRLNFPGRPAVESPPLAHTKATNVHILGNTFVHNGLCIRSAANRTTITGNVAKCMKFMVNTGKGGREENNKISVRKSLEN